MGGECQWHEPTLRRRDTSQRVARQGRGGRVESHRPPCGGITKKSRNPPAFFVYPLNLFALRLPTLCPVSVAECLNDPELG